MHVTAICHAADFLRKIDGKYVPDFHIALKTLTMKLEFNLCNITLLLKKVINVQIQDSKDS